MEDIESDCQSLKNLSFNSAFIKSVQLNVHEISLHKL